MLKSSCDIVRKGLILLKGRTRNLWIQKYRGIHEIGFWIILH